MGFKRNRPVQEFSSTGTNVALDLKLRDICIGLKPSTQRLLLELSDEDKELIADFIIDWSNHGDGVMMAPATKKGYINTLVYLSRYVKEKLNGGQYKPLKEMTRDDFFKEKINEQDHKGYLRNLKREFADDPDEKWVNTYNTRASKCLAFFKWVTQKDIKPEERQKPPQLKEFRVVKRSKGNRHTTVRNEDTWLAEEHEVLSIVKISG